MKTPKIKMLIIAGALLGVTSSCQKDGAMLPKDPASSNIGASRVILAQQLSDDLQAIFDAAYATNFTADKNEVELSLARIGSGCASVTLDTLSKPSTMTIDFGPSNCTDADGQTRRGKLIATITGPYRKPGTVLTYTTEDFYLNDNRIDAHRVITNLGYVTDPQTFASTMHFNISDNITITLSDQTVISQQADIDREFAEGEQTESTKDDIYFMRGHHSSTMSTGEQYYSETTEALRKDNNYRFIFKGVVNVSRLDNPAMSYTMDYSYPKGVKDNLALITYSGGQTEVVTLK